MIFDVGGVLEITPATSCEDRWAARLGLDRSDMISRLELIWNAGEIGAISLDDVEQWATEALGPREAEVPAFMDDQWSFVWERESESKRRTASRRGATLLCAPTRKASGSQTLGST